MNFFTLGHNRSEFIQKFGFDEEYWLSKKAKFVSSKRF